MKRLSLIFFFLGITICSCQKETKIDSAFLQNSDISLTVKGSKVFIYNENNSQLGYNESNREFRVSNDDMSDYYIIKLNSFSAEKGFKSKGSIRWTDSGKVKSESGLDFEVGNVSGDKVWLWNGKKKIGAVVQILK